MSNSSEKDINERNDQPPQPEPPVSNTPKAPELGSLARATEIYDAIVSFICNNNLLDVPIYNIEIGVGLANSYLSPTRIIWDCSKLTRKQVQLVLKAAPGWTEHKGDREVWLSNTSPILYGRDGTETLYLRMDKRLSCKKYDTAALHNMDPDKLKALVLSSEVSLTACGPTYLEENTPDGSDEPGVS